LLEALRCKYPLRLGETVIRCDSIEKRNDLVRSFALVFHAEDADAARQYAVEHEVTFLPKGHDQFSIRPAIAIRSA
jgi:hypothetical protein